MSLICGSRSSPTVDAPFEICIVIDSDLYYRYEVFVADVGFSTSSHLFEAFNPRASLLFKVPMHFPYLMSFFGFGPLIYFLGGIRQKKAPLSKEPAYVFQVNETVMSKDVFAYDTSSAAGCIKQVGSMNHGKHNPLVIGPIKEKFYVLSRFLLTRDLEEFSPKSGFWVSLNQVHIRELGLDYEPLTIYNSDYEIKSYVVLNNEHGTILMSTHFGLVSYDISKNEWGVKAGVSLPFTYGGLSIGGDMYLVYIKNKGLCTYRYCDGRWDEVTVLQEDIPRIDEVHPLSCFSSGDGLVCAVKSGNHPPVNYNSHETSRHFIKVARFRAINGRGGPDIKRMEPHIFEEKDYNVRLWCRNVQTSFPLGRNIPSTKRLEEKPKEVESTSKKTWTRNKMYNALKSLVGMKKKHQDDGGQPSKD